MSKVYRFTSNQDQNDQRLILHIIEYISPAKLLRFVILVCNYRAGPHVAAAIWPCTYLCINLSLTRGQYTIWLAIVEYL